MNFIDGNLHIHVTVGPMMKEEIPRWIRLNKEVHFDPGKAGRDYLQVIAQYPDVAVFYDIDVWCQEESIPTSDALVFAKDAPVRIEKMIENFQDYCFAREVYS